MLTINAGKAKLVAQKHIRIWRDAEFKKNDIKIQNAIIDGDDETLAESKAYRNYLRDLPQQCEGKIIDELKALMIELGVIT